MEPGASCTQAGEMKQLFILRPSPHPARKLALEAVRDAPDDYLVEIREPTRTSDQNALFHAICSDLARSPVQWAGKRRTAAQWKVLLVSGHSVATSEGSDLVPGLENEYVNLRESTALMSVKRGSSLIEYALAWCTEHEVALIGYWMIA